MRISKEQLQNSVNYLNLLTNNPVNTWEEDNGKMTSNIGNYYVHSAYGGVALYQITNDGGGVRDVLNTGFIGKSDLYNRISAYKKGIANYHKKLS